MGCLRVFPSVQTIVEIVLRAEPGTGLAWTEKLPVCELEKGRYLLDSWTDSAKTAGVPPTHTAPSWTPSSQICTALRAKFAVWPRRQMAPPPYRLRHWWRSHMLDCSSAESSTMLYTRRPTEQSMMATLPQLWVASSVVPAPASSPS